MMAGTLALGLFASAIDFYHFPAPSTPQEHNSPGVAILAGAGGPECHHLLQDCEFPSVCSDSAETGQRHRAVLSRRHIPPGEPHTS